ncbi:hypothetical protein K2173_014001 [Erythroxylum novogranatense]|uniref:BHLH domain-containing protein n=1 Tax=Erythroxylum novogranatense TaxID=1862640 RepID=A0AAV8SCY4_9ROSI|nr:hypothetical protein K2173_014001 [Erythroxylum novogranatense]
MGNLLREVLKTLCCFNQWCYAVFWKLGCQNPKLLIWEECYCELNPSSVPQPNCGPENSELLFGEHKGFCGSDTHFLNPEFQARDKVQMLVDKMMLNNQVYVVGEGIVGRAAFTGKHDWILTNMYTGDLCPPEVLNELHHQFSAGVQTVAVIPAFPYGVVQVGSLLSITENMGFVNNVRSLILQLGCNPGALSGYHSTKDSIERIDMPISDGAPISTHMINSTTLCTEGSSQQIISAQASNFLGQTSHSRPGKSSTVMAYSMPHVDNLVAKSFEGHSEVKSSSLMKSGSAFRNPLENVLETELLPSNFDAWLSQHATSNNSMAGFKYQPVTGKSITGNSFPKSLMLSDAINDCISNNRDASQSLPLPQTNKVLLSDSHGGSLTSSTDLPNKLDGQMKLSSIPSSNINPKKLVASYLEDIGPQSVVTSMAEEFLSSTLVPQVSSSEMLSDCNSMSSGMKPIKGELVDVKEELDNDLFQAFNISSTQLEESLSLVENISGTGLDCLKHASANQHPPSGDDLYDILGVDLKSKLIYGAWNNSFSDGPHSNTQNLSKDALTVMNMQDASCDIYSIKEWTAGNSIFSAMDNDHLLDAVVSRAQSAANQSSDDNVSCRTTLTKMSTSSVPSDSCNRGRLDVPNQPNRGSFDLQKSLDKAGTTASSSIRSDYVKGDKGASSQSTSICGSQLSSWVEQAHNMRPDCSISTAFSKKSEELSKPNRKRLKPGENPRPRPKDRQMIQDRVKELREIVPNGTKCSIDALLERTIKHMLFLQSVIKHADKLKQTGESKIISKEGELLLKDNFDGGATWAFEVGSQSMVCPIIVEDLNPPRQMLVEMLCEECGIFLEIADLIKGLGLTILKGVMEARNDKIWARFAVEANRDVTRMEIFVSLVRILEQTMKGSTSSANILENNNMMVHQAFSQAPSIAATGRPSSLQ